MRTDLPDLARFTPDPVRPYLSRCRTQIDGRSAFLKLYNLTAWSPAPGWHLKVRARCALIERVTSGLTRFRFTEGQLLRISTPVDGFTPIRGGEPLTKSAFAHLWDRLDQAHLAGLPHGDLTRRNLVTDGVTAELIDWEPILLGPGPGHVTDPVPDRVFGPARWLGGCDLLRHAPPTPTVPQLDLVGLNLLRRHV